MPEREAVGQPRYYINKEDIARVTRERAAQGFAGKITDPEALALVAAGILDHRAAQARLLRRKAAA